MRIIVVFTLLLALAVPASAEGPIRLASQQPMIDSDRAEWQGRVERADSRRKSGRQRILLGLGITGGSLALIALTANRVSSDYEEPRRSKGLLFGTIGLVAGAGVAGYGSWRYSGAKDELEMLDREGRAKGYLAAMTGDKGVRVAVRLSF